MPLYICIIDSRPPITTRKSKTKASVDYIRVLTFVGMADAATDGCTYCVRACSGPVKPVQPTERSLEIGHLVERPSTLFELRKHGLRNRKHHCRGRRVTTKDDL